MCESGVCLSPNKKEAHLTHKWESGECLSPNKKEAHLTHMWDSGGGPSPNEKAESGSPDTHVGFWQWFLAK
jgi:hypothetical protein